jgi:hypothetical protein
VQGVVQGWWGTLHDRSETKRKEQAMHVADLGARYKRAVLVHMDACTAQPAARLQPVNSQQ